MLAIAIPVTIVSFSSARAAISYATPSSLYSENFDGLPIDAPSNASIETVYPDGWRDDTTTVAATHVSVPGWHLYHPLSPAAENGFNGNQRFRMGPGANTGSFYGFSLTNAATPEKALGAIGSNTMADPGMNMYSALRLVNDTGITLNTFTLTFDGEQWRDGQSALPETLSFDYSATATTADWFSTATFLPVPTLNFTAPVFTGVAAAGTAVDGNVAGRVEDISATVTGVGWAPGTDLWLRWADPNLAAFADDGLAIDDVRFSAVPEPAGLALFGAGVMALVGRRRRR